MPRGLQAVRIRLPNYLATCRAGGEATGLHAHSPPDKA